MSISLKKLNQKGIIHLMPLLFLIGVISLSLLLLPNLLKQPKNLNTLVKPTLSPNSKIATESAKLREEKLKKYLVVEAALLGVSNNISLYFKDMDQSRTVSIDPTKSWIPASTIKSYLVLEVFRQKRLGLINFDSEISIKAENVVPTELETDEYPRLRVGTTSTIRQLVEAMITQSDNTAYNTLLDILDRRNVNLMLKNLGLTETVVGEKLNLDNDQLAIDLEVAGRQPNTTTVKDLVTFFELLYDHKYPDSEEILAIFKKQKINNMIPALLPPDTVVAHKTGDWAPIYHDAGVVYKNSDPFALAVFTNNGDPSVVAKIAKVAYYQEASAVDSTTQTSSEPAKSSENSLRKKIYIADSDIQKVLGVKTDEKFPTITASDLGITVKDLQLQSIDSKKFAGALITPNSLLYNLKKSYENFKSQFSFTEEDQVNSHLQKSKSRLAEAKSLITSGDITQVSDLLKQSETELETATVIAKNSQNKDLLLTDIKNVSDLHFATLAERGSTIDSSHKDQYIDAIYDFLQENQQKVAPIINSSIITNPTEQKPAIGSVTQVQDNKATLKFDDGTTKDIVIPRDTKVRAFQTEDYQGIDSLKDGDKVAVIGQTNSENKIIPQFILTSVPQDLPAKHQGTVIEINPDKNTLKILDKKGKEEIIKVTEQTSLKSKDTNVSLEGIKAGSQVTVFGVPESSNNLTTNTPSLLQTISQIFNPQSNSSNSAVVTQPNPTITSSLAPSPLSSIIPQSSAKLSPQPQADHPSPVSNPAISNKNQSSSDQSKDSTSTKTQSQSSNPPPTQTSPPVQLKATSITVTNNSSGSNEKVQSQPSKPAEQPKPAPAPKKEEQSKNDSQKDSTKPPTTIKK